MMIKTIGFGCTGVAFSKASLTGEHDDGEFSETSSSQLYIVSESSRSEL
jgi:hypothetical protein